MRTQDHIMRNSQGLSTQQTDTRLDIQTWIKTHTTRDIYHTISFL